MEDSWIPSGAGTSSTATTPRASATPFIMKNADGRIRSEAVQTILSSGYSFVPFETLRERISPLLVPSRWPALRCDGRWSQAIQPKLLFPFERLPILGGDLFYLTFTLIDLDEFTQQPIFRSQIQCLVVGGLIYHKENHVIFVGDRDVKPLDNLSRPQHPLHHRTIRFPGQAEESRNVRRQFSLHAFVDGSLDRSRHPFSRLLICG